jgi:dipeptidyl-peptidase-4
MKRFLLLLVLSFFVFEAVLDAQTKTLTIDDAVVGLYRELYPEYIQDAAVRPDVKEVTMIENGRLIAKSFNLKKETVLVSLDELNSMLKNSGIDELKRFPSYKWLSKNVIRINPGGNIVEIDISKKVLLKQINISKEFENVSYCEKNSHIAYTLENNLYIQNEEGKSKAVSTEDNKNIVYGQTVHRNEFGIDGGIFWSPNGEYLAFYRKDETMVTDYPIVNTNARIAELDDIKYCMAGMNSEEVTLGVYSIKTGNTIYLNTGEPKDQYLTCVTWSPDEKSIYIATLNREQNHMRLNRYDAVTGEYIKTLFEEKHNKYVEPSYPLTFLPKDPSKFIWQSRNEGYSHLYLYDVNGNKISQITKGNFEVQQVYGFTADGKDLIIKANKETPIDFDIYRVNITSGAIIRITQDGGNHNAIVSNDGAYIIDVYSNLSVPKEYVLYETKGKKVNTLLTAKNTLADYKLGELKIGTLKADDNKTDLYYRMILPTDFDPSKKYPCIVYVYGGPHAQMVTNGWLGGASGWDYYMAQQGYIMFTLDNRGSANRGLEFENIIHRQVGAVECRDQLTGIEYLKSLGYVDMDRIGVHGWSYGGFMTTTLMTDYADIFKAGVAGGPVINWELYEVMYGERYMDTPQENPEGYQKSNLINKVEKLKGRLMLIHGAIDPVVVWQHSLNFLDECIEKKILVDYFVYPSHEHNVRGLDRVHLMRTITRYFEDNL